MSRLTALVVEATMLVEEMALGELDQLVNAIRARQDELDPPCGTCGEPHQGNSERCSVCGAQGMRTAA